MNLEKLFFQFSGILKWDWQQSTSLHLQSWSLNLVFKLQSRQLLRAIPKK